MMVDSGRVNVICLHLYVQFDGAQLPASERARARRHVFAADAQLAALECGPGRETAIAKDCHKSHSKQIMLHADIWM